MTKRLVMPVAVLFCLAFKYYVSYSLASESRAAAEALRKGSLSAPR